MTGEQLILEVAPRWHQGYYSTATLQRRCEAGPGWPENAVCIGRLAGLALASKKHIHTLKISEAADVPLLAGVPPRLDGEVRSVTAWKRHAELFFGCRLDRASVDSLSTLPRAVKRIHYLARKEDGELVEWVHQFKGTLPKLKISDRWVRLVRAGSTYRVDPDRGIVG